MCMQLLHLRRLHILVGNWNFESSSWSLCRELQFISRNKRRREWHGKYDSFTIDDGELWRPGELKLINAACTRDERDVFDRKCHRIASLKPLVTWLYVRQVQSIILIIMVIFKWSSNYQDAQRRNWRNDLEISSRKFRRQKFNSCEESSNADVSVFASISWELKNSSFWTFFRSLRWSGVVCEFSHFEVRFGSIIRMLKILAK